MNTDYRTTRRPAGQSLTDADPPFYEIRGYSAASFSGKCVVTGGHMRPLILEQIGNEVSTHPMGIKPPLIAPAVTTGTGGGYTGKCQIAFQRINDTTKQRSDISPVWPSSGAVDTSPEDLSWTTIANNPSFSLGKTSDGDVLAFAQAFNPRPSTSTSFVFGDGTVPSNNYLIQGIQFYAYIPSEELSKPRDEAGVPVQVAIFKGSSTVLGERVTDWVDVSRGTIPRELSSPTVTVRFPVPAEVDTGVVYRFVVQVDEVAPTSRIEVFYKEAGSVFNITDETVLPNAISAWDTFTRVKSIKGTYAQLLGPRMSLNSVVPDTPYDDTSDAQIYWTTVNGGAQTIVAATFAEPTVNYLVPTIKPIIPRATAFTVSLGPVTSYPYSNVGEGRVLIPIIKHTDPPLNEVLRPLRGKWVPDSQGREGLPFLFFEAVSNATMPTATRRIYAMDGWTGPSGGTFVQAYPTILTITGLDAIELGIMSSEYRSTALVAGTVGFDGKKYLAISGETSGQIVEINSAMTAVLNVYSVTELDDVTGLVADPNTAGVLYMRTSNVSSPGVYKSTDGGATWALSVAGIFTGLDVSASNSPTILFACTKTEVKSSTDAGASWSTLPATGLNATDLGNITVSPVSSTRLFALDRPLEGWYSDDGGATFQRYVRTVRGTRNVRGVPGIENAFLCPSLATGEEDRCWIVGTTDVTVISTNGRVFSFGGYTSYYFGANGREYPSYPVTGTSYITNNVVYGTPSTYSTFQVFHKVLANVTSDIAGRTDVYAALENATITIDTSLATTNEPEAIIQGGTEDYDKLSILIRDLALGTEFREIARVALGGTFTFGESALALGSKRAIVPGFYEVAGGFEAVENYRVLGTERLVFISQPGYDGLRGIPGSDDYLDRFLAPYVYRNNERMFLVGQRIGEMASIDIVNKTIVLNDANMAQFDAVEVGDELPFVNSNGNGGYVVVESKSIVGSMPQIDYYDYAHREPTVDGVLFMPTGAALVLGTVDGTPSDLGDDSYSFNLAEGFSNKLGLVVAGDLVAFRGATCGYITIISADSIGGIITATASAAGPPPAGAEILFPHSSIHFGATFKGLVFLTQTDQEIGRAWPSVDTDSGLIELYTDWARTILGTNGADPQGAYALEARWALLGTISKGETRIVVGLPVANDYWHQRDVSFLNSNLRLRIKKIVKYDTNTGELLLSPQIELYEPWTGDDQSLQPMEVISDYSSLHIAGAVFGREVSNAESISDLTKLNLVPKTGTIVLAGVSGRLFVFAEKDEIFEVSITPFVIPTNGLVAEDFAIEAQVNQIRQSASFAISSTRYAIDEKGTIYLAGPQGIFFYVSPNVYQIRGMRDRFGKFYFRNANKTSLALDPSVFPEAALRVANVGYTRGETTEQLAYSPSRERWLNFGGGLPADEIAGAEGQDNSALVIAGARGKVYVYGQVIVETDHTGWDGEDYGRNYLINGQVAGDSFGGYISGTDVTVENAGDPLIYKVNATYFDATATSKVPMDLDGFGIIINTPTSGEMGARQPVESAILGVSFIKWNDNDGTQERGVIVGIKLEPDGTNTIYVKSDVAWTDLSGTQRYYWAIGARPYQITTREIIPGGAWRGCSMNGIEMVVKSSTLESHPWWIRVEVFADFTGKGVDFTQTVADRVYSWREFVEESRLMRPFYTVPCVGFVVRVSGHAPTDKNFRIVKLRVIKDDCMI